MKLSELNPQFVKYETRDQVRYLVHVGSTAEAQGLIMLCPSCFVRNKGPIGTHALEVSFANKGVPDEQGSHNREGQPVRWATTGNGYDDLTTQPSILIDPEGDACAGWHGFITNGEIT